MKMLHVIANNTLQKLEIMVIKIIVDANHVNILAQNAKQLLLIVPVKYKKYVYIHNLYYFFIKFLECKYVTDYTNLDSSCSCKVGSTDIGDNGSEEGKSGCQLCHYPCIEC